MHSYSNTNYIRKYLKKSRFQESIDCIVLYKEKAREKTDCNHWELWVSKNLFFIVFFQLIIAMLLDDNNQLLSP